jgi:ATP synthase F1 delta subunit
VTARATGAARRYARTLVELAVAGRAGEEVREGLRASARLLAEQAELRQVLAHPGVSGEKKRALVERLWKDQPPLVRRLVAILSERQRIALLPEVERLYSHLWNIQRGVVEAEALSAQPLAEAQRTALQGALRRLSGREVELTATVAPEILGGLLVRMDGRVYDGSVRGRLRTLRRRLVGEAQGA